MQLWVGLGNPGAQYAGNRHNIGFMALDRLADAFGVAPWRARFRGEMAEARIGTEKVLLLKPMTFMNLSGDSVAEALRFFKLEPADLTVFHDELDLAPGRIKVKQGGGHAGHNGLRSIHGHLGAEYRRVRLGIGHPGDKRLVSNYVLHDFAKADEVWIDDLLRGICDGAPKLAGGDGAGFMNAVALRMGPEPQKEPRKPPRAAPGPAPTPGARPTGAPKNVDPDAPGKLTHAEFAALSPLERLKRRFR
ncbi:MAG: PTH1 family peptidyl-tRNA hydrolase [Paracoccaceae bacterium]|jgi:PTH1 family peptidyl-tRNA hydrolase